MRVGIVLPPREMFSPLATGAVGLLARRMARPEAGVAPVVYGMPVAAPFDDVAFQPVRPALRPYRQALRYAVALEHRFWAAPPDLIEVHNRPDIARYLATRLGVPVVLFLHNDPQGMRSARTVRERRWLVERLADVAPVSAYLRGRLLDGVGEVPGAAVFSNFVDLAEMPAPRPGRTILFAGRMVADKGADNFVAACALALPALPGWRAMMIGADRFGVDSPETPFLRALRPRALAAGVELMGWQPHEAVLQAMAAATMVVVPSRWQEPFGLTALEAMACGAPLLCAPRGGLGEVMGDAALALDPEDPAGMAAAMVALAADPARRTAMSLAGLARANVFDAVAAVDRLQARRRAVLAAWQSGEGGPI